MPLSPGIYPDYPIDEYHADPCVVPSLNQTTAKVLLDRSPAHARAQHPRLCPDYEESDEKKFDVGSVAHKLLLGRGRGIAVLDFPDWRTKASQEARASAKESGQLPILSHQFDKADAMAQVVRRELPGIFGGEAQCEVVAVVEIEPGIWLRTMIDCMPSRTLLYDVKTTDASAAPHAVQWLMAQSGWDVQAATQERILDTLDPANAGRRKHRFVCIEAYEPYALSVIELSEAVMHIGRSKLNCAIDIWTRCITEDRWPGYGTDVIYPEYPPHVAARWVERMAGEDVQ